MAQSDRHQHDAPEAFAAHPGSENYTSIRREKKGFDYGPEGDQMRGPLWEAVAQENGRWAPGKKTMFNFGTKQPSAREVATHEFTHLDSPYPADVTKTIAANPAGKMSTADVLRLRDLMKYEEARAYAAEMRGGWSRGEREAIPAFKTVKEDYGPPDALDWLRAAKWAVPSALAASAAFSLPLSIMDERDKRMLPWVNEFNPYDLYSKSAERPDVRQVKPFYDELIAEYFPAELRW
jgi:hypothetical protein